MNSGENTANPETTARDTDPRSDAELVRLFVEQHDQPAMTAIIRRHGPLVMGLCHSTLKNEQDVADAFQATFLVLLKKARSIGKPASLASWLHGVAHRVAVRARLQSTRRQNQERSETDLAHMAQSTESPGDENISLIHEELCRLPERFRLPILLCCLEGESREEAARRLGWTVGALKGRLERGREMLRIRLLRQGLVFSTAALTGVLTKQAMCQVPLALVGSTVQAMMCIATGQSLVAGAVSTQTAVLTQGVLKAMMIAKLKIAGFVLTGALIAGALFLGWSPANGRGGDRPREVPKDGAWVQYEMEAEDRGVKESVTITVCFVGSSVEEGVTCRWLEIKHVTREPEAAAGTTVYKILVSEKDLLESERPFEHARRAWFRGRNLAIVEMQPDRIPWGLFEDYLLWTPGMLKSSKAADDESKDVEYQRGKFRGAEGRKGEHVFQSKARGPVIMEIQNVRNYTVWQHPDLPFGFAAAKIVEQRFQGEKLAPVGRFSRCYRIQDFGADAKSELPDND